MKNRTLLITLTILISISPLSDILAISGDDAVARFRNRMNGAEKLAGTISWTTANGTMYTGAFKYMRPGMIHVKFSSPPHKTIVSNGKKLWIYDSSSNICGVQDLGHWGSGGIAGMISGYNAVASGGGDGYTIRLKSATRNFPEIVINTDGSFMLRRATLKNKNGDTTSFSLNLLESTGSVSAGMFNFSVPSNAQVINNPLNIK